MILDNSGIYYALMLLFVFRFLVYRKISPNSFAFSCLWEHLASGNTWPLTTPGLWQHLASGNTWPLTTPGLWQHLACGNTWPLATPGLWQHLASGNTWPLATPGLWQHLASGNTWPLATPGLWQHLVYYVISKRSRQCYQKNKMWRQRNHF